MRHVLIAALVLSGSAFAQETSPAAPLFGTWDVELHYSPDSPPSSTAMMISGEEDGVLTGSFYGTPFETARFTDFEGELGFIALTSDSSGLYVHTGRIEGDEIRGRTLARGRDFIMPWIARPRGE